MLSRLFALVILVGLVAGGVYLWKARSGQPASRSFEQVGEELKDAATTGAVKAAFGVNRSLKASAISISTENGVVTLRGQVPGEDEKRLAVHVASAVPDVRQVVDQLGTGGQPAASGEADRSLGESLDDKGIEMQVRLAFSLNRHLKGASLEVRSFKKQVRLSGEADDDAQRAAAVAAAREVPGVAGVEDGIHVRGQARPAGGKRAAVEAALRANPSLAADRISVGEEAGRIVLRGHVRSGAERDLAGLLARDAAGEAVQNALEIEPDAG